MESHRTAPASVDAYIAGFPAEVQGVLRQIRTTIRAAAPEATEEISYGIPAFRLAGRPLIYFAGFKKHLSVYPAPMGVAEFQDEMSMYGSGKGTVKFPLGTPVPLDLVRRIVQFRAGAILARPAREA